MKSSYIPHQTTNCFSKIVIDYLQHHKNLDNLFEHSPNIDGIKNAIAAKKKHFVDRKILAQVLINQYEKTTSEAIKINIDNLFKDNTYTICTAHQPNIFTGPLYFVYKILHTVSLSNYLKNELPEYNFVPIYYMGSEDADIDEIGTFNINNETFHWQSQQSGAVGRMNTNTLQDILQSVNKYIDINTENGKRIFDVINTAYTPNKSIAEATFYLVNELFAKFGLVIINADSHEFKQQFIPIIKDEILNNNAIRLIEKTNQAIAKNYKVQASARQINLFYLKNNLRERIELVNNFYKINNTAIVFSQKEILEEIENFPEHFSPNVILRGLLQETILPNIAYIGGGGELAYWLQLKNIFNYYKVPYPVLILRQSFLILDNLSLTKMNHLNLENEDLFLNLNDYKNKYLQNVNPELNFNLVNAEHINLFLNYKKQMQSLSVTMQKSLDAHIIKSSKIQKKLQEKIIRNYKKQFEDRWQKFQKLRNAVFPNETLQERFDNFIPYYIEHGEYFFEEILQNTKPFGESFAILRL